MNLQNVKNLKDLQEKKYKKIFFYRICGTGMGAAACLLKEAGYEVHGIDSMFYPPMSDYLEAMKVSYEKTENFDFKRVSEYDLIVVGNTLSRNHEHARILEESGVDLTSFPEALGALILKNKSKVIGISGTHGKTTTTYLMVQLLRNLGVDTGYLIGGVLEDGPSQSLGGSDYFVIEADEYDSAYFQKTSKFRHYCLNTQIVTSLEFDHADIFETLQDIEKEFIAVYPTLDQVIAFDEYESIKKLYGDKSNALFYSNNTDQLTYKESTYHIETNLDAFHNRLNLKACLLYLLSEGFKWQDLSKACLDLKLVKRRQEFKGAKGMVSLFDDFAHHPRAVSLTINALKSKFSNRNVLAVFDPISATARSRVFESEFIDALANADEVVLLDNKIETTVSFSQNIDLKNMSEQIEKLKKIPSKILDSSEALESLIESKVQNSKQEWVVLIMSNRTALGFWQSKYIESFK